MFIKYLPRYFPSQKWNKKITFPLLFSIICCLSQYHQQAHLVTLFFCIGTLLIFIFTSSSTHCSMTLKNSFSETGSCLFLCLLFDNLEPEIRSFFLSFLQACKLSKADSKAKTSSIHPTSHCGGARNKSVENFPQKIKSKKCLVVPSLPLPYSNLTLSEKKREKTSPSSNDIVTQYFVTL